MRTLLLLLIVTLASCSVKMPDQPETGFGSNDYPHQGVDVATYGNDETSGKRFWIFTPSLPTPATAPVVIFNHGYLNKSPRKYRAWIEHLVKRGNIVIYSRFQDGVLGDSDLFVSNSTYAAKNAIELLQYDSSKVQPDLNKVAMVAHSIGCLISVSQAATAESENLPKPKAIFCAQPGATWLFPIMEDPAKLPGDTLLVVLVGSADLIVGQTDALTIIKKSVQIPDDKKFLFLQTSDNHNYPPLVANHDMPLGVHSRLNDPVGLTFTVNAFDYQMWKLCDATLNAAFSNQPFDPEPLLDQGQWSDGKPVKKLKLITPLK